MKSLATDRPEFPSSTTYTASDLSACRWKRAYPRFDGNFLIIEPWRIFLKTKSRYLMTAIAFGFLPIASVARAGAVDKACILKGKKLWGKVQVVDAFPDLKVQRVTAFPDVKVQEVTAFPDSCGKWQFVTAFPDFKIQYVTAFPDVKIQVVTAFPGVP